MSSVTYLLERAADQIQDQGRKLQALHQAMGKLMALAYKHGASLAEVTEATKEVIPPGVVPTQEMPREPTQPMERDDYEEIEIIRRHDPIKTVELRAVSDEDLAS